jgi:putative transposase
MNHFRNMVHTASLRGFHPYFVMFDSWYSGNDNLKFIDKLGWNWFSRVKKNRMVNPDDTDNRPVSVVS